LGIQIEIFVIEKNAEVKEEVKSEVKTKVKEEVKFVPSNLVISFNWIMKAYSYAIAKCPASLCFLRLSV
jgi:hypothetical protein